MKLTNKYNLPEVIFDRLTRDLYDPDPDRIGATTLIDAPMKRHLKIKYWDKLEEDASERLWALLGQAVHYLFDGIDPNSLTEERLEYRHESGLLIVSYPDIYKNGVIRDYKVTSVWSYIYRNEKMGAYTGQNNINAFNLRSYGFEVNKGYIDMILRDWQKSKVENGYPPIPFATIETPIWTPYQQKQYIDLRMDLHTADPVPLCTPDEMWEKPTTYAVKKKGRKTALRVLYSMEEATGWKEQNGGDEIEIRPGERTCCKEYCMVRHVCPHNIYQGEIHEPAKETVS